MMVLVDTFERASLDDTFCISLTVNFINDALFVNEFKLAVNYKIGDTLLYKCIKYICMSTFKVFRL